MDDLIIDGSEGEGGGQILRSSLALSIITGQPFRIHRIRAQRSKPGLRLQHRACVLAAARVGNAQVEGAEVGSQDLLFRPGALVGGEFHIDIGSAGSTSLVLQSVLPALLVAPEPSRLVIDGGTHNPMAPTADFLDLAFFDQLRRMGVELAFSLERYGFFPEGGGRVVLEVIPPAKLMPRDLLERGEVAAIDARCLVANLPRHIAEREASVLAKGLGISERKIAIQEITTGPSRGNVVTLRIPHAEGSEVITELGAQGVPAEKVAKRACMRAKRYLAHAAPVGDYLADQLLLPWALAGRGSFRTIEPSLHTRTNIAVVERFLPLRFRVEGEGEVVISVAPLPGT